jgi:hypothetical protein
MDHCTLGQFWHDNRVALGKVFRSAVKVAAEREYEVLLAPGVETSARSGRCSARPIT